MKRLLLIVPVLASALGWATVPILLESKGSDLEGAYYLAGFGGMVATALTAPLTIVTLAALGFLKRISLARYVGLLFIFAIPAMTFEAYVVSASAMGLFIGGWAIQLPEPTVHVALAATFIALYVVIGLISYPFVKGSVVRAALAAGITVTVVSAFMVIRFV